MPAAILSLRDRLDRTGMVLSGLCALHCLTGLLLVGVMGIGGQFLLSPVFHQVGLALAIGIGALSLGLGALRHGRVLPLLLGLAGVSLMGLALVTGHSANEALLTIAGVTLVACAHVWNLRHTA